MRGESLHTAQYEEVGALTYLEVSLSQRLCPNRAHLKSVQECLSATDRKTSDWTDRGEDGAPGLVVPCS